MSVAARLTGLNAREQAPMFLVGFGHGGTHWLAAILYILLPFIADDMGLSYAQAGSLIAIFHASAFAANFASGAVVDLTGRRVLFQVAALVIGAIALIGFGASENFLLLAILVAFLGASNNLFLWRFWGRATIFGTLRRYPSYPLASRAIADMRFRSTPSAPTLVTPLPRSSPARCCSGSRGAAPQLSARCPSWPWRS